MHAAHHRLLFRSAIALSLLAVAPIASAQTLTLPQVLSRKQPFRNTAQKPFWVSRADCLAKDELSFVVNMVGYVGYSLQVWAGNAGTDCAPVNQRQSGGSATCWLVYNSTPSFTPLTVTIKAVDLVARTTPDTLPADALGFPAACNQTNTPIGQQLTLYFMFVNSGTTISGTPQTWTNIGYDLSAPAAPTSLTASAGETRLHLNWQGTVTNDTTTFKFYCDPPPGAILADGGLKTSSLSSLGTLALGDGGFGADTGGATGLGGNDFGLGGSFGVGGIFAAGGDTSTSGGAGGTFGIGTGGAGGTISTSGGAGGTDTGATGTGTTDTGGSTSVGTSCSSTSIIQPGLDPVYPNSLDAYECGSVSGNIASSGVADHLVNNVNYVVAVSAVDLVGNASPLSATACGTPVEVTDFYELYRDAGGKAGGGICSLSRIPNPGARSMLAMLGVLAGVGVVRRVRRRHQ